MSLLDPAFTDFVYMPRSGNGWVIWSPPLTTNARIEATRRSSDARPGTQRPHPQPQASSSSVAYSQVSWKALWKRWAGMDTMEKIGHCNHRKGSIAGVPRGGGWDGMWIITSQL